MSKHLLRLGTLCLMLALALTGKAQDVTATWDFTNKAVVTDVTALTGSSTAGTVKAVEDNGVLLTVEANGQTIRDNGNSIQTGNGVVFKVPVKTTKDIVTVVGYSAPYFAYSIGGTDATEATTVYKAKAADVEQGYAEVVNKGQYLISIKVEQKSALEEKQLYKTDFSDWDVVKAGTTETKVAKTTKYTNEALTFTLYNTASMSTDDSKFSNYTTLPHMTLRAEKAADPYITTTPLASITKVRYIHGATGGSRGWKLEAKGDGDADWVVVSDSYANPSAWCEVEKDINKTNVQLRWTNLNASQNAYLFELDIYGMADMSTAPLLGTFKVNGTEYVASDIFEQDNSGNYTATIELSKKAAMVSASNKLADVTADNGELGDIVYDGNATQCQVTIPVTANGQTVKYIANIVQKPDFTLTYFNTDGTKMGTQQVEKDAAIETFAIDYTTAKLPEEGTKVRGWFAKPSGGTKYKLSDVVTSDLSLYAYATEIEVASTHKKYVFNLANPNFYAEDHEAFNPTGKGKYHDVTHGWEFANGDKIELLVGPKATISFAVCRYSKSDAKLTFDNGGEVAAYSTSDGDVSAYTYEGTGGTLTATVESSGSAYIHSITIVNTSEVTYDRQGNWIYVKAGDVESLESAIDAVNSSNAAATAARTYIFIPNGVYDFKQTCLTTLSANNVSLIGQSQTGTVIMNAPDKENEGIGTTATLVVTGRNNYLQDLTIKNALDYYASGSAGRAVCLWDKGNRTICKNVTLLSYQDTYYSNNNAAQLYWEDSDIHGTVDFICGGGDVRFQNTTLSLEPRKADGTGSRTITAPTTNTKFGYVFDGCTVVDLAKGKGDWNLGRTWQESPICIYLNTTLDDNAQKTLIKSRWTEKGMNNKDPKQFGEYGTMDAAGNDITPASNTIVSYGGNFQTILTAAQVADYAYDKMFADWNPAQYTLQAEAPADAKYDNGTVTWTPANNGAIGYALFLNGDYAGMTEGNTFNITIADTANNALTIRAANQMGGFGPAAVVAGTATAIQPATVAASTADVVYNLKGMRLQQPQKGLNIVNGKKVVK